MADILVYGTTPERILHGAGKVVEPAEMELLPPQQWTSLELVRVRGVVFERDPCIERRWQARFSLGRRGPEYRLPVTDPVATMRLGAGERIAPDCLLTVSLTAPLEIGRFNKPKLCYKLVAGVIELPGRD